METCITGQFAFQAAVLEIRGIADNFAAFACGVSGEFEQQLVQLGSVEYYAPPAGFVQFDRILASQHLDLFSKLRAGTARVRVVPVNMLEADTFGSSASFYLRHCTLNTAETCSVVEHDMEIIAGVKLVFAGIEGPA